MMGKLDVFIMSLLMTKVATESDFIQCDITYDERKEYPYIFNAVVFNSTVMEWMAVVRVRLDKQTAEAYALAFRKIFDHCSQSNKIFEVGKNLLGVVIDWSDAEAAGLNLAPSDVSAQFGPPNCVTYFTGDSTHSVLGKRNCNKSEEIECKPNTQPDHDALGKKVKMKFETSAGEQ